jgi:DNA-binding transcriptional regulator of glucitol operon
MDERILTNETWNSEGKLIEVVIVKIITYEDGTIEEQIINTEKYEN